MFKENKHRDKVCLDQLILIHLVLVRIAGPTTFTPPSARVPAPQQQPIRAESGENSAELEIGTRMFSESFRLTFQSGITVKDLRPLRNVPNEMVELSVGPCSLMACLHLLDSPISDASPSRIR